MTITTTKTWQFDLNNFVPADNSVSGNAHYSAKNLLWSIKEALTGFTTNAWTVVSSSDSTTSGASDLWVDPTDLVWRDDDGSAAFSWIVLRQAAVSTTFEILLACEEDAVSYDGSRIGAWVAQAGFTGGSTTARPTATDERQLRDSTLDGHWGAGADGSTYDYQFQAMMSSDGECTRVLVFTGNVNTGFWLFDKPKNPISAWTNPYLAFIRGNNDVATNQAAYSILYDSAQARSRFSGVDITLYLSGEGFGSAAVGEQITVQNQLDGSFVANAVGLCSVDSTVTGRIGEVFDLWWGLTVVPTGRYFPTDGSMSYVQVHHMIFPWNGSTFIGTE